MRYKVPFGRFALCSEVRIARLIHPAMTNLTPPIKKELIFAVLIKASRRQQAVVMVHDVLSSFFIFWYTNQLTPGL